MQVDGLPKPESNAKRADVPSDASAAYSADISTPNADQSFQLYDLRVEVICPPGEHTLCGAKPGDHFTLEGEMLKLPPGQGFSIYSLGAVLPLLAAKQRVTTPYDWMTTDSDIACPDPNCSSKLRIIRTGLRTFRRGDTTVVPLPTLASPGPSATERSRNGQTAPDIEPDTPQPAPASPIFTEAEPEENQPAEGASVAADFRRCPVAFDYLRADWG